MNIDHTSTYELPGGYVVAITVFQEVDVFNLVSIRGKGEHSFKRAYWTPLKDCKKTAKAKLNTYLQKKAKYSNAQPNKKR